MHLYKWTLMDTPTRTGTYDAHIYTIKERKYSTRR